jgi:hypothetical protein
VPDKAADRVELAANPTQKIVNIEKVDLTFKDGVDYDQQR